MIAMKPGTRMVIVRAISTGAFIKTRSLSLPLLIMASSGLSSKQLYSFLVMLNHAFLQSGRHAFPIRVGQRLGRKVTRRYA